MYIIVSSDGWFWTGKEWAHNRTQAQTYKRVEDLPVMVESPVTGDGTIWQENFSDNDPVDIRYFNKPASDDLDSEAEAVVRWTQD